MSNNKTKINIGAYDTFSHIKSPDLRTWNRVATLLTIRGEEGKEGSDMYYHQFDDISRKMISNMLNEFEKGNHMQERQRVMKAAFNE